MKKRILILMGVVILALVVVGASTTFASNGQNPWTRIWQVFVTNWPANQNVTVTNTAPIPVVNSGPEITKWEYFIATGVVDVTTYLNQRGQEGWEFIGFYNSFWIFKRPIITQ